MFFVAEVVKTFGLERGIAESLDDFRYKTLHSVALRRVRNHLPLALQFSQLCNDLIGGRSTGVRIADF